MAKVTMKQVFLSHWEKIKAKGEEPYVIDLTSADDEEEFNTAIHTLRRGLSKAKQEDPTSDETSRLKFQIKDRKLTITLVASSAKLYKLLQSADESDLGI